MQLIMRLKIQALTTQFYVLGIAIKAIFNYTAPRPNANAIE